jgi:hypothetical protein
MLACMYVPKVFKLPSSVILVTSLSLCLTSCNEAKVESTSTESEQNASNASSVPPEIKKDTESNEHAGHAHVRKATPSPEALKKLPADGGSDFNRLVFEQSPYLLQHAGNPINWYPWGEEAFAKAKKENKPVFLSVGYTTCHWCHVMEHESFEDDEVAALMNKHYVCVKVDREERPDIDNVYMSVTQMMTGRGGWPMTVIMTPEKVPFFSGTYFPKQSMMQLLPHFSGIWANEQRISMPAIVLSPLLTTALMEALAAGRSFPLPTTSPFYSAIMPEQVKPRPCEWWRKAWRRLGKAESTITLASAFTATPRTNDGFYRTLKKCSTTKPSSLSPT